LSIPRESYFLVVDSVYGRLIRVVTFAVAEVRTVRAVVMSHLHSSGLRMWSTMALVWRVEAMKAAEEWAEALRIPRPPIETGREASNHFGLSIKIDVPTQSESAAH
jgi:hypothetical protein